MCGRCGVRSLALLLQALLAVGVTEVSGVTPSVITPVVTPSVITLGATPGVTLGVTLRALAPHSDRSHGGLTVERCQSLDLETFTCWWSPRPEDAAANYSLLYYTPNHLLTDSCGNEKTQHRMFATNDSVMCECPDYETGGLNSCYFNTTFTFLFRMYCFLIWDRSRPDIDGQQQFCTTVADITQTNPPWNLTWELVGDEAGEGATEHELGEVRLRWQPPLEPDIRSGWITLEYQIRVRDNSTLNWTLREEHVSVMHHVLLGPRPGRPLEVQVRCKPRTLGIWSEWSESLLVITEGWDLLQVLLVLGVLVSCCLLATLLLLLRCHTRLPAHRSSRSRRGCHTRHPICSFCERNQRRKHSTAITTTRLQLPTNITTTITSPPPPRSPPPAPQLESPPHGPKCHHCDETDKRWRLNDHTERGK